MTPQEQQLLQDLAAKINQTTLPDKDAEAEQFLAQSLGRNPDAIYILAQTVLVQNYALTQAQGQLEQLKQQAQQQQAPQKHTSFLGNLLGMNDDPAPPPPPPASQTQYAPVNYAPPPSYGAPQYAQPPQPYGYAPQGGMLLGGAPQGGGFLQSALRTATGVAAGALAFEGIESLMSGFGHHAGYGGGAGFGGGFEGGQPREEVINNYYGDDRGGQEHGDTFGNRLEANRGNDNLSSDLEDRRDDDNRSFAAGNTDDASSFADSDDSVDDGSRSYDNGSSDDNSFDPGGNDTSF